MLFLLKLLEQKRKRRNGPFRFIMLISIVTVVIISVVWIYSNDIYFYILLLNGKQKIDEITNTNQYYYEQQSTGSGTNISYGSGSVPEYMLVSKLENGFCKDYLTILKNMCDWKTTHPDLQRLTLNGKPYSPSIISMLAFSFTETGVDENGLPYTLIDLEKYNDNEYLNLYDFNSQYLIDYDMYGLIDRVGPSLLWGSYYYTQYQLSYSFANVYPTGIAGNSNSTLPSTLNGYSIADTTLRQSVDVDAAYFPDQVSIVFTSAFGRLFDYIDEETIAAKYFDCFAYVPHNGGEGMLINTWACGAGLSSGRFAVVRDNAVNQANGVTYKQLASDSINHVDKLVQKAVDWIHSNIDILEFGSGGDLYLENHSDYGGLAMFMLLLDGDGFFATQDAKNKILAKLNDAGYARGARLAFRICEGIEVDSDYVYNYANNLEVQRVDESFYGTMTTGKNSTDEVIHYYDENRLVCYFTEGTPRPAVHGINCESARGVFAAAIYGNFMYYNMLVAGGVEVTLEDAINDSKGTLITEMPSSSDSYYYGTKDFVSPKTDGTLPKNLNTSPLSYRFEGTNGVHWGEDWCLAPGTTCDLAAIADGVVIENPTKMNSVRGWHFVVEVSSNDPNEPTITYRYQHLNSRANLEVGDTVKAGDIIAVQGNSGIGGYHLHLELVVEKKKAVTGSNGEIVEDSIKASCPFGGIFYGYYTPEIAPGIDMKDAFNKTPSSGGSVIGKDGIYLGTLKGVGYKSGSAGGYDYQGVDFYRDEALSLG